MIYFILENKQGVDELRRLENELAINFASVNNSVCSTKYEHFEDIYLGYPRAQNTNEIKKMEEVSEICREFVEISYEEISDSEKISRYQAISGRLKEAIDKI